MAKKKFLWFDPSQEATDHLNTVLKDGQSTDEDLVILDEKIREKHTASDHSESANLSSDILHIPQSVDETIRVTDARHEPKLLDVTSDRQQTRLLFITKDVSYMQEGSIAFRRIADIRGTFLEIHIVVLDYKKGTDADPVLRLFNNVWLYTTESTSWWKLSFDAYHVAEQQLVFSGGFRADIIVADDPFESGLVGLFLSKKYERPFQLHVYEDFHEDSFIENQEHPSLYAWTVRYVLHRVQSVRTKTEFQRHAVVAMNPELESRTELLPGYYNLEAWRDFVPTHDLRKTYPQFKFILLHISSMRTSSHSMEVLNGSAKMLRRYPSIGLVMVGNGPLRSVLERQAIALGLQKQIEFEPMPNEIISHLKTANVLIHLSEDGEEDDIILAAATVKLPMIANTAGLAGRLFVDEESACLCACDDVACVSNDINRYLNENQDRARYAINAYDIVFEQIEQDYGAYLKAYRQSIEGCMVA